MIPGATNAIYTSYANTITTYNVEIADSTAGINVYSNPDSLTVHNALGVPTISASSNTIDPGNSVTLTAHESGGTGNFLRTWYYVGSGGFGIPINTTTSNHITISPTYTTNYYVQITDNGVNPLALPIANSPFSNQITVKINITQRYPNILDHVQLQLATNSVNYDQLVTVNSLFYGKYEAGNLQNVEFYTPSNMIISSWLENNASNTITSSNYWLDLASLAPVNGIVAVEMGFAPMNVVLLNNYSTGEAPTLSSIYGQYDDGATVFNFYDNFAGISLDNKWVSSTSGGGNVSVNNELTLVSNKGGRQHGGDAYVSSTQSVTTPAIFEVYVVNAVGLEAIDNNEYITFTLGDPATTCDDTNSGDTYRVVGYTSFWRTANLSIFYTKNTTGKCTNTFGSIVQTPSTSTPFIQSYEWIGNGSEVAAINPYSSGTVNTSFNGLAFRVGTYYPAIETDVNAGSIGHQDTIEYQWARARNVPPNDVMPSVSFGSVKSGG